MTEFEKNVSKIVEEAGENFSKEAMQVIDDLIRKIEESQLGDQFNKNITAEEWENKLKKERKPIPSMFFSARKLIDKEGEAGYKKAQLYQDLQKVQQQLLRTTDDFKNIISDFEHSKKRE